MSVSSSHQLCLITDDSDPDLVGQLRRAAELQGVEVLEVEAARCSPSQLTPLSAGALLYRIGTTHASCLAEQVLYRPDVATFYSGQLGPFMVLDTQPLLLERSGVCVPRATHRLGATEEELRAQIAHLGGFPVVLKVPGYSLGVGVIRIEDWPTLFAVVDLVEALHGSQVSLMQCIEPATHWRVILVGTHVASAYINPKRPDDFRTFVDESCQAHFVTPAPEAVIEAARHAVAALQLEFGGVDVLLDEQGRAHVLEVNFPCYFAHPWRAAQIDVASAMVAYLVAKSSLVSACNDPIAGEIVS